MEPLLGGTLAKGSQRAITDSRAAGRERVGSGIGQGERGGVQVLGRERAGGFRHRAGRERLGSVSGKEGAGGFGYRSRRERVGNRDGGSHRSIRHDGLCPAFRFLFFLCFLLLLSDE